MSATGFVRSWYLVHKWTSLVCTGFLLVLCVSGLPLIFSHEIESWIDADPLVQTTQQGATATIDDLAAAAKQRYPGQVVRFIYFDDDEPRATVVMAPSDNPRRDLDHEIEFDMRTAAVVNDELSSAKPPSLEFMQFVLRLHTDLFAGFWGEMLLAAIALAFVAAIVSGVVLYGPYMRKLRFGTVRTRSRRVRWLDLHNLLGITLLAWMLCVGITGIMNELTKPLSAVWRASEMQSLLTAYKGLTPPAHSGSAQAAFDAVEKALPGRNVTSIIYPSTSFSNPHHYLIWTNGDTPLTSRLFSAVLVDAGTGALTAAARMPLYLRALQLARPLHFGDYGGLPLKILWALLDIAAICVLISGLYLWFARRPR